MKKFFLFLIAAAMVPGLAFGQATKAQNPVKGPSIPKHLQKVTESHNIDAPTRDLPTSRTLKLPVEKKGGIFHEALVRNGRIPAYATNEHFLEKSAYKAAYDPYTNGLFFAYSLYTNETPGDETTPLKAQIWIYKSFDRGTTWETVPLRITSDDNKYYMCPTLEIANPYKTKNPDSLFIIVNTYSFDLTSYLYTGCSSFRLFKGEVQSYTLFESLIPQATWRLAKPLAATKMNAGVPTMNVVSYGSPAPFSQDVKTFLYCTILDRTLNNGTVLAPAPENVLPEQWALSNFRPDPIDVATGSTAWSPMNGACDNEGTPYVMLYNYDVNSPNAQRTPAVSKSTDLGESWSDLEWFPYTSLLTSMKAYDNDITVVADNYFWWAYEGTDMIALGPDQLSVVRPIWLKYNFMNEENAADSTYNLALVEYKKDGNVWSANPITSIKRTELDDETKFHFVGPDWAFRPVDETEWNGSQSYLIRGKNAEELPIDEMLTAGRNHEIQVSKTPNGDLVAKWVDFTGYDLEKDIYRFSHENLLNTEQYIDSLLKTDVYMAYRKAGSNTWSTPIRIFGNNVPNMRNFSDYYPKKGTYIPRIVPSLNEIPLFDLVVDTTYDVDRQNYSLALQELGADGETGHMIACHKVALDSTWNPDPVETPSIELQSTIGEIYPNPTKDKIEFSFTLTRPAFVNIEIFNSVGEKVALVHNGTVNYLANAVSFNGVKDFPSGVYYCIVTIDGQKTTRKFTVAR